MILIVFLFCLVFFILGLVYIFISDAISSISLFSSIIKVEEKKITKAYDDAFNRLPKKQKTHLYKAETRYKNFLKRQKEKDVIHLLKKVKWVL